MKSRSSSEDEPERFIRRRQASLVNAKSKEKTKMLSRNIAVCIILVVSSIALVLLQIGLVVSWKIAFLKSDPSNVGMKSVTKNNMTAEHAVEDQSSSMITAPSERQNSVIKNDLKPMSPRTFEMMTADISDFRSEVSKLKNDMVELKNIVHYMLDSKKQENALEVNPEIFMKPLPMDENAKRLESVEDQVDLMKQLVAAATNMLFSFQSTNFVKEQTRLLIISEPRSGSTQFAEMLNLSEDIFYLHEPCRGGGEDGAALYDEPCWFFVQRLLSCVPTVQDITNLFRDTWNVERSRVLKTFSSLGENIGDSDVGSASLLNNLLTTVCKQSRVVVVKEIRITEVPVESLPSMMKVIHMLRDPRDTMLDAMAMWRYQDGGLQFQSFEYCRRTNAKVESLVGFNESSRIFIKYEEFAGNTFPVVSKLYKWLKLGTVPQVVSDAIEQVKKNKKLRKVGGYEKGLSLAEQEHVLESCRKTMQRLHYIDVSVSEADGAALTLGFPTTGEELLETDAKV